ncbi:cell envelope integrity protein TolA [Mycoavidus sp. B2-EB]|uniref:cell envelope integrity protein TolA n=1 Tax=Mycoavidus sp. B2-EB TaxID=2651972 RepID=UPI0016277B15|nr:cell envelope integrity protein TolA [Mycoavidus sp. B2-EB]BBO60104.1 protein TolA [Mycoavidus sp. B2-EB]
MKHDTPSPFLPPRERGTRRALICAVLMHTLLFAFLFYGIRWQSNPPAGAEAELWSAPPETTPKATPTSAVVEQTAPAVPSQPEQAEIALQQTQPSKPETVPQQQLAQLKQQQAAQKMQERQQHAAQEKKVREAQHKLQLAEQQKTLQAQQQARNVAKQQRQARLLALQGIAGQNPAANGISTNGSSTGAGGHSSAGYVDKVRRHVKSNMAFSADSTDGNPQAVVSVQCAPDGTILNAQITKTSGNPGWDNAVLRAVQKSDPMPRDSDGKAPSSFTFTYRLND